LSGLIDTVRELRALTGCGLKVAHDYVKAGWKIGDPVDQDLIRTQVEAQAAKLRLERAAPALLEALIEATNILCICQAAFERLGMDERAKAVGDEIADARAAITAATQPASIEGE
jgi:hypothetical protein